MSIEKKIKSMLEERGMWPEQAEEVVKRVKNAKSSKFMQGSWKDSVSDYSPVLFAIIWITVEQMALEYIDKECPKAWFRDCRDCGKRNRRERGED